MEEYLKQITENRMIAKNELAFIRMLLVNNITNTFRQPKKATTVININPTEMQRKIVNFIDVLQRSCESVLLDGDLTDREKIVLIKKNVSEFYETIGDFLDDLDSRI